MLRSKKFVFILVAVGVVLIDQLSKVLFAGNLNLNQGISFGLKMPLITNFSLIVIFGAVLVILRKQISHYPLALGLFFGGAVSNLLDRFIYGGVRDFLPIPLTHLSNNLADWAIVVGIGLILIRSLGLKTKH